MRTDEIIDLINGLPESERRVVLMELRKRIPIHPMEVKLMAPAEVILEAIGRSGDLTVRGIEGIIAECSFVMEIVPTLSLMKPKEFVGEQSFDSLLTDDAGDVRVQVKMQRRKARQPLMANEVWKLKKWPADHFIVETQRTRTGEKGGEATRPYRFGSFDILAVSMGASRGRWSAFMYTLERWLIPAEQNETCLATYQPIPPSPNSFWTDDFMTCVGWLRSGVTKRIPG